MCGSMNMNEWLVCSGLCSRVSNNNDNLYQVWIFLLVNECVILISLFLVLLCVVRCWRLECGCVHTGQ